MLDSVKRRRFRSLGAFLIIQIMSAPLICLSETHAQQDIDKSSEPTQLDECPDIQTCREELEAVKASRDNERRLRLRLQSQVQIAPSQAASAAIADALAEALDRLEAAAQKLGER